MNNFCLRSYC